MFCFDSDIQHSIFTVPLSENKAINKSLLKFLFYFTFSLIDFTIYIRRNHLNESKKCVNDSRKEKKNTRQNKMEKYQFLVDYILSFPYYLTNVFIWIECHTFQYSVNLNANEGKFNESNQFNIINWKECWKRLSHIHHT